MVYPQSGHDLSATYWCALSEGELLGNKSFMSLSQEQADWLASQEDRVTAWLDHFSKIKES